MKFDKDKDRKVIRLDEVGKARGKAGGLTATLRDSKRVAEAIRQKTCIICGKTKMCVNKTGLCAACYLNLDPREKSVADEEARHKRVELRIIDDRWGGNEDT
ncbi:MAG: hypothetical protein JRF35_04955 [Deltaproteobacteria bacterium]|nr:hypothetical protein [Deltaproteobacteria bacterium]